MIDSYEDIRQILDTYMPSDYSIRGFEKEKKLTKVLMIYQESMSKLQQALENFPKKNCKQTAGQLLELVKHLKGQRAMLDFLTLVPSVVKRNFSFHDDVLQQAEALAAQVMIPLLTSPPLLKIKSEEKIDFLQQARGIEANIHLKNIYDSLKNEEDFCHQFCQAFIHQLDQAYELYQHAYNRGALIAEIEMRKIACTKLLLQELRDNKSWILHSSYLTKQLWEQATDPLQYGDTRFEPLLRFFMAIPDHQDNFELALAFIHHYMSLEITNPVNQALLSYAKQQVYTQKFSQGHQDWDEDDLQAYRQKILKGLITLVEFAKYPAVLPDCNCLPISLKVNTQVCKAPRIALLKFAHQNDRPITGRLEWSIDYCMSLLRDQRLKEIVKVLVSPFEDQEILLSHYNYLARRFGKFFRLLIDTPELNSYDPKHIHLKFTNLGKGLINHYLYDGHRDDLKKLSEKTLIKHLIHYANAENETGFAFRDLLKKHVGVTQYLHLEDAQKLSEAGARALLYMSGYLKEA